MAFNRGEKGNPFRDSFFTDASLRQNMLRLKALQDRVNGPAVTAKVIVRYLGARS